MRKPILIVLLLGAALALGACGQDGSPTPSPATSTPKLIPTATPPPPPTPLPTASGPFLPVGHEAEIEGQAHGVAGTARVLGDRQILIRGFSYDGKGKNADIRLAREGQFDQPLAVLAQLDEAVQTALLLSVPPDVEFGAAEVIVVYSQSEGKAYGVGKFGEAPPPTPPPAATATPTGGPFDSPAATPES